MRKKDAVNAKLKQSFIMNGFAAMPGGFFIYRADDSEEILYANQATLEIFECESFSEFIDFTGGRFSGIIYPDDREAVKKSIVRHKDLEQEEGEKIYYRAITRSGYSRYVEDFGRFYVDPEEGPLFCVFISIAQVKHDTLTRLPNMRYFLELAGIGEKKMYQEGKKPVTLSMNLIGMNGFNSKYGHEEGDRLLIAVAELLKKWFGLECSARFGEDHYCAYTDSEKIEEILDSFIVDLRGVNGGKTLGVRIGIYPYDPDVPIDLQCNRAGIASDSRRGVYESGYAWYNTKMSADYIMREHILSHLDQAIAEKWIRVYFQPVIRAMSGKLCSMEALVRWIDPKYGMISPGLFIPLLEEKGLSYKVDIYVINRVAEIQKKRVMEGDKIVPISINISRSDFDYCDPVVVVSSAADSNGLRRSLFSVEITESAIVLDSDIMKKAIDRFHDAGIEVWMDDFGSGYSSLNALKEFTFDELKIDMIFLRNFNDSARKIITSIVKMSKSLGIHTLAEGVETQEQLDFLREIGCERIQGYFYGKPMLPCDAEKNLSEKNVEYESREEAAFYQKIGEIDLVTGWPLALIAFNNRNFDIIFTNTEFRYTFEQMGFLEHGSIDKIFNSSDHIIGEKFRRLAERAIVENETVYMPLKRRNRYYNFSFNVVSVSRDSYMLVCKIDKTFYDEQKNNAELIDSVRKNIADIYGSVYILDLDNNSCKVIYSNVVSKKVGEEIWNFKEYIRIFEKRIHTDDSKRWNEFTTKEHIIEKLNFTERGSFSEMFRVRQVNGSYIWLEFTVMAPDGVDSREFLLCVKPSGIEDYDDKKEIVRFLQEYYGVVSSVSSLDGLWENFVKNSGMKVFWKDKDRRFKGVSRAFLDYYDFDAADCVIGKTDEEVGWHVDDNPYMNDEYRVLQKGEMIINSRGKNVVDGVIHDIAATKFPIYANGEIVGLMGYFFDIDSDFPKPGTMEKESVIDTVSGLMNPRGLQEAAIDLDDNYRTNGEDYFYVLITIDNFEEIRDDFGVDIGRELIKKVAEVLKSSFASTANMARSNGGEFTVLRRNVSEEEIYVKVKNCTERLKKIRDIEGRDCRLRVKVGISRGSEGRDAFTVASLARSRLDADVRGAFSDIAMSGMDVVPDPYKDMPLPYIITRPIMDEKNEKVIDIMYVYVNDKFCELLNVHRENLLGRGNGEIYPNTSIGWMDTCYRASRGEYISGHAYAGVLRNWIDFYCAPLSESGCCVTVFEIRDSADKVSKQVDNKMFVKVKEIAEIMNTETCFNSAMEKMLKKIAETVTATRYFIIETDKSTYSETYEYYAGENDSGREPVKNKNYEAIRSWEEELKEVSCIRIDSVSALRKSKPDLYEELYRNGVDRIIAAPMYSRRGVIGYLGIENFDFEGAAQIQQFLEIVAYICTQRYISERRDDLGIKEAEDED